MLQTALSVPETSWGIGKTTTWWPRCWTVHLAFPSLAVGGRASSALDQMPLCALVGAWVVEFSEELVYCEHLAVSLIMRECLLCRNMQLEAEIT